MAREPLHVDPYRPGLILVGFGGETSRPALVRAAELAKGLHARLLVAHVALSLDKIALGALPSAGLPEAPIATPIAIPLDTPMPSPEESPQVAQVHELLGEAEIQYEVVAVTGDPAERLVDLATARKATLIVVGGDERGFLERLLEGSVATDVSRHAPCDVLVVRPPATTR